MIEHETVTNVLQKVHDAKLNGRKLREHAMACLAELPNYDWSGIYRLEDQTLHLDAYVGAATDHELIPVGKGVCGTAIAENRNQVVEDVREISNYLACSSKTRSEIVVLIRRGGTMLGQIDVDSHEVSTFDSTDERMLTKLAAILAEKWD